MVHFLSILWITLRNCVQVANKEKAGDWKAMFSELKETTVSVS